MFYLAYLCVTGPLLLRRIRGTWPLPDHGPYFSLGRFGFLVNATAVVYGAVVAFNIAWPRKDVYNAIGASHWYFEWAAYVFIGAVVVVGALYYFLIYNRRPIEVIADHRAQVELNEPALGDVAP